MTSDLSSERVLVVAPFGRDAEAAVSLLGKNGLRAVACEDLRAACAAGRWGAGVIVVAEEAMTTPQVAALSSFLDEQPPWSDIPIIVLARGNDHEAALPSRRLQGFNVTLLERPLNVRTLLAAVQVALRARRRQYEVRLLLEQRTSLLVREREARERAESASRAKDEFLAILGHELRNPLAPIVTALDMIRFDPPKGFERELTIIDRQVTHLARLVDDLLDVSRIAQGKIELKRERIQLAEIVARAVEMTSPLLEQKRHHFNASVPDDLFLMGDATRVAQVLANLIMNSAKYTAPGGRIDVVAARQEEQIEIRVRDDGIGMTSDMLPRIFNLFAQERQEADRAPGGLGLGLSIVRSLVTLHGGTVEAHSDGLGKGSELVVRLPALKKEDEPAEALVVRPSRPPPASGRAPRILVVDDNEDAAELLAYALSGRGYSTRIAHDGPQALVVAGDFSPDVAVLDIGLPVMDGYELAHRLRASPGVRKVRLVALTGYGQAEDARRAREAGFEEHLVKPVDFKRLDALVTRLLQERDAG
jgi:signal transduction histidine kinase/ActR/RegA family two-component response regulator